MGPEQLVAKAVQERKMGAAMAATNQFSVMTRKTMHLA